MFTRGPYRAPRALRSLRALRAQVRDSLGLITLVYIYTHYLLPKNTIETNTTQGCTRVSLQERTTWHKVHKAFSEHNPCAHPCAQPVFVFPKILVRNTAAQGKRTRLTGNAVAGETLWPQRAPKYYHILSEIQHSGAHRAHAGA